MLKQILIINIKYSTSKYRTVLYQIHKIKFEIYRNTCVKHFESNSGIYVIIITKGHTLQMIELFSLDTYNK